MIWIGLFLSLYTICSAREREKISYSNTPYGKQVLIKFMGGTDFDVTPTSSDPLSGLMGTRPSTVPMIGMKVTHLFSGRIGWYANIHFNFYKEKDSELDVSGVVDDIFKGLYYGLFGPVARIRPSMDIGLTYRFEKDRWALYPRLGAGYMVYLANTENSKTKTKDGDERTISYRQKAHPAFLNAGFSVNYLFSERAYLVFNADFRQPLQKSYAELTQTTNGIETDRLYFQTKAAGRGLTCGLGIGLRIF